MNASRTHGIDPCALVVERHTGAASQLDLEIARWQEQVRNGSDPNRALERLGWAFVAQARESFDTGFYTRAEQCALCLDARQPGGLEAMLLRGHALHNQHRFKEAEPIARELVARRGLPFDYGLLGDVLMEQGRLDEATDACQKMIDLRPDLHSYARGAHLRWLKGDLAGAAELMQLAASAGSPLEAESAAWVHTRLGQFRLQMGALNLADQSCQTALELQRDYAPALLLRGRTLLAQGKTPDAVEVLQRAAQLNPLPEYQWALAEALRVEDRIDEALAVETQLVRSGARNDPRTLALYLATRGQSPGQALRLAQEELAQRSDIFTHDALAWALATAGKLPEARSHMEQALAEGTQDARLFFHAAVITAKAGSKVQARHWFDQAVKQMDTLLPPEQQQLLLASLETDDDSAALDAAETDFSTRGQ